ncbi:MAG: hypothetical protein H7255_21745, partial [Ramlibacter sp.]|nr:hypothetical protein [Ramlibacter sp.]
FVATKTPFATVRYSVVLDNPGKSLDELAAFCAIKLTPVQRQEALAFVSRPKPSVETPTVAA